MVPLGLTRGFLEEGAAEDDGGEVLGNKARYEQRDNYIEVSGGGVKVWGLRAGAPEESYASVPAFVVSSEQGDVIKLKGGTTGASFEGFLFFSLFKGIALMPDAVNLLRNVKLSREEGAAYAMTQAATNENYAEREAVLTEIRKKQVEGDIKVIRDSEHISLKPGETFTITNNEDAISREYFTEMTNRIQWSIGFEVVTLSYDEGRDFNEEFGEEIEDQTEFKGLATRLFKFLRAGRGGGPTDFVIESEEEGGFQFETETFRDQFGDWWSEDAVPWLRGMAKAALVVIVVILVVVLLYFGRAPFGAIAGWMALRLKEVLDRD